MKLSITILLALLVIGCATNNVESRKHERAAAYSNLSPEMKALVDQNRIKVGMPMDAVYIAWGKPAEVLEHESQEGGSTTWLYYGGFMEESRYWGRRYPYHDYQPRTYVSAEVVFVNGVVASWRNLPQPVY